MSAVVMTKGIKHSAFRCLLSFPKLSTLKLYFNRKQKTEPYCGKFSALP